MNKAKANISPISGVVFVTFSKQICIFILSFIIIKFLD